MPDIFDKEYTMFSDDNGIDIQENGWTDTSGGAWDIEPPQEHMKHYEENPEDVMVEEDPEDNMSLNEVIVEDDASDNLIPGSKTQYLEDAPEQEEKKNTNWADDGDHEKFIEHIQTKITKIPQHSGNTIPGCERALSYLKAIESEISKAMRSDLDGKVDEQKVDDIRKDIANMCSRLDNRINQLKKKASVVQAQVYFDGTCAKCGSTAPVWHDVVENKDVCVNCEEESGELSKKASTPVLKVFMTPFERAIVGIIINATVSGGKNMEETYNKMKNKYSLTPREELAVQQLIFDHGYPYFKDRGLLNEDSDPASGNGVEWQTNYQA